VTLCQRIEEVLQIRLMGGEFVDLRNHAEEQGWNVSLRQLRRYAAAGDKLLENTLEKDRPKLLRRHIAQRRSLFARCMAVADYSAAGRVLRDEAELLHLYDDNPTSPTPGPGPAPLAAAGGVKVLTARLAEVEATEMPPGEKARLTSMLADALLRAIAAGDIDERLAALEARLGVVKGQQQKEAML
jgi:hypothetical protein